MQLRKYKNRLIKSASSKSFFNADLFQLFREENAEIICYETRQDITHNILLRVIMATEQENKNHISQETLYKAIRAGGFTEYIKGLERSSLMPPSPEEVAHGYDS